MGYNDHIRNPEDVCSDCGSPVDWEDAYVLDERTLCGACFDKKIDKAEAEGQGER